MSDDNVNCMPSVLLFEGDLRSIMIFLEKMDLRVSGLGAAFAAITGELRELKGQLIAGVQSGRMGASAIFYFVGGIEIGSLFLCSDWSTVNILSFPIFSMLSINK